MADLSKVTLPNGETYNIKDAVARDSLRSVSAAVVSAVVFKGVSSAALTDSGTENPVVDDTTITAKSVGDLYFYGMNEFIWGNDSKWHLLGAENGTYGRLAYASSVRGSVSFTPAGTVSQPTFSGAAVNLSAKGTPTGTVSTPTISLKTAGSVTTIHNPTKVTVTKTVTAGTASSNQIAYFSVSGDTLTLQPIGYTTGDSISITDVDVKTGDGAYQSSQPTFSGAELSSTVNYTPGGTVSKPDFTGTNATITVTSTALTS